MDVQLFFKNMTDYITALSSIEIFKGETKKNNEKKNESFT